MPVPEMPPQGAPPVGQTFEERKAKALDEIDRHIADLRKLEACIQATTNPDQMRSCRPPHEPGHRRPVN